MKNKKVWIILGIVILVIAVVIIVCAVGKTNNSNTNINQNASNESGETPTDLELTGEEYTASHIYDENGNEVTLEDFADKPMVLLFFNTTELNANEAITILEDNYEKYKSQINFVNIALSDGVVETKEKIDNYIKANSITMPVLYDTEYTAKEEYEVEQIPTFVFINKNQEIINTVSDPENITQDVIEANLDILSENY